MSEIKKIGLKLDDLYAEFTFTSEIEVGQAVSQSLNEIKRSFNDKFNNQLEANKHHEAAMDALVSALDGAKNDPAMTPEVRKIIEWFVYLSEFRRPLFSYEIETILRPVIEQTEKATVTESVRKAAKATRKKTGKDAALLMYEAWAAKPTTFKNQTQFTRAVKAAKYCDSITTALDWLNHFRTTQPCEELEKGPLKK